MQRILHWFTSFFPQECILAVTGPGVHGWSPALAEHSSMLRSQGETPTPALWGLPCCTRLPGTAGCTTGSGCWGRRRRPPTSSMRSRHLKATPSESSPTKGQGWIVMMSVVDMCTAVKWPRSGLQTTRLCQRGNVYPSVTPLGGGSGMETRSDTRWLD